MATQTRSEALNETLEKIINNSFDLAGALVASQDGLVMASHLPIGLEDVRVGALATGLFKLSTRTIVQLNRGEFTHLLVQSTKGTIVVMSAGSKATLVTLAHKNANMGMMFLEAREAAEEIAQIFV